MSFLKIRIMRGFMFENYECNIIIINLDRLALATNIIGMRVCELNHFCLPALLVKYFICHLRKRCGEPILHW